MKTTLNKIRKFSPCESGWAKLLKHLGKTQADDEPLDFLTILKSNGLDDALWCLKSAPISNVRMYAIWCAKQVQHLMTDQRSRDVLDIATRHADGLVTDQELDAACAAAEDAADAAYDAACDAACDAVRAAARDAAWSAALVAASGWAADAAEGAAGDAAWDDAWDAACDAVRAAQKEMFIAMCEGSAPWQVK